MRLQFILQLSERQGKYCVEYRECSSPIEKTELYRSRSYMDAKRALLNTISRINSTDFKKIHYVHTQALFLVQYEAVRDYVH